MPCTGLNNAALGAGCVGIDHLLVVGRHSGNRCPFGDGGGFVEDKQTGLQRLCAPDDPEL